MTKMYKFRGVKVLNKEKLVEILQYAYERGNNSDSDIDATTLVHEMMEKIAETPKGKTT